MGKLRVVLSGAAGFLGSNILKSLLDNDVEVYAISSKARVKLEKISGVISDDCRLKAIFPNDLQEIGLAFKQADVFINCAFPRNTDGMMLAKGLSYISNLFVMAHQSESVSVINISSQSVYSQKRKEAANEKTPVCLESPYAVAKYSTELLLNSCCSNVPHTNVRLASLVGPYFNQRAINKMIERALRNREIVITDTNSRFGYLDVRDAVSGLVKMCESESCRWDDTYNLGPDHSYSIHEMAEAIKEVLQSDGLEVAVGVTETPNGQWVNSEIDSLKFKQDFSWTPHQTLKDTIRSIIYS